MSDALTAQQVGELERDLIELSAALSAQLERLGDDSRPVQLDQQAVGRLSRMDAMQQQQMAVANATHIRAHLSRVKRALAAIASGDFGFCHDCGTGIPFARLKIRPDSPLCVACQSRNET